MLRSFTRKMHRSATVRPGRPPQKVFTKRTTSPILRSLAIFVLELDMLDFTVNRWITNCYSLIPRNVLVPFAAPFFGSLPSLLSLFISLYSFLFILFFDLFVPLRSFLTNRKRKRKREREREMIDWLIYRQTDRWMVGWWWWSDDRWHDRMKSGT